ncbi:D-fructose-6-phosphate amidotransferase [Photobacterium sp. TY1-4]|uniref:D-fructose-6-phosphate amidotransferase n=1 Tax=Photobacterium sp. TY1-4 TaxID=2899122 RepID=UPI0021BFE567|nr:D-fructose-6-phosphate amidotransferase [Photobacterium sp. TY1-4]UXI03922.1 D-fructose-6-phosphate amidotransferase [Photobacterium sp. TY1-4]
MTASKLYLRDLLGITMILSAILVTLGSIFGVLAILTHFSHEDAIASTFLHESVPLFVFLIPFYLISRYINRPQWVIGVQQYLLEAAIKANRKMG